MKKFTLTIQEQVTIWQNIDIIVDAESKDELLSSIAEGALYANHNVDETSQEFMMETMEHKDFYYEDISTLDIEEVADDK